MLSSYLYNYQLNPINRSTYFFWGFPLDHVATVSAEVWLDFKYFVLAIANLSSHNCGIFHYFNVELIWRHPGQGVTTKAWLECDSVHVTWIENTRIKRESNWTKKKSQIPLTDLSWIESRKFSWIWSKTFGQFKLNPVKNLGSNQFRKTWFKSCTLSRLESEPSNLVKLPMPMMGLTATDKMQQYASSWRSGRMFSVCEDCDNYRCRRRRRLFHVVHYSM